MGGNKLLLANFHDPRSLQCNSQNGGLPQPAMLNIHMQCFLEISSVTANWIWNMQVCSASYVPALIGTKPNI